MNYRKEIDGLRAICILPVIFYHFNLPIFSGGYIGVDIFCSIWLFNLFTSNKRYKRKKFFIKNFYERRARSFRYYF